MKLAKYTGLAIGGLCIIGIVVAGTVFFASRQGSPDTPTAKCPPGGLPSYHIIIKNDKMQPAHTAAMYCGKLTVTNEDSVNRLMAFGAHDHHKAYDGTTEVFLGKGQSLTVDLVQRGSFEVHDHLHDEVDGTFTVR